jgi:hypothetical protein
MRIGDFSRWFLLALAVVTVLGHICALPFHAHAGAIETHGEPPSHHGDADADALHGASCEVVKSRTGGGDRPIPAPVGVATLVAEPGTPFSKVAPVPVVIGSPPLFLLHAALLI